MKTVLLGCREAVRQSFLFFIIISPPNPLLKVEKSNIIEAYSKLE